MIDQTFTDFPNLIKRVRINQDLNMSEFGARFNVTHAAVSNWESGKNQAPYRVLEYVMEESGLVTDKDECMNMMKEILDAVKSPKED
jgi:transcriptional regulator with XRE-family HTH domain